MGNDLFASKKDNVIETNELQIRGHLLRWKDMVIQISNISQISIGNYSAQKFPLWSLVIVSAGLLCLYFNILIGLMVTLFGAGIILEWYQQWQSKKDLKFLHLYLNSGTFFSFIFESEDFLYKVLEVFANIFENVEENVNNSVTIDIKNCTVQDNGNIIQTLNSGV